MPRRTALLLLVLLTLVGGCSSTPRAVTPLADVRERIEQGLTVTVEGQIHNEEAVGQGQPGGAYVLRDRFGTLMFVRTSRTSPEVGATCVLAAVVARRESTGEPFLLESSRECGQSLRRILLISLGGALVVLLGLVAFSVVRSRQPDTYEFGPAGVPAGLGDFPLQGRSDEVASTDRKTIKLQGGTEVTVSAQPAKTGRLLPGRLVLLDEGRDAGTFHLVAQRGDEVEIGRESADARDGLRIKDSSTTLSRKQARIAYARASDSFRIINLAGPDRNPTQLNGRSMSENEIADLADGDRLTMGTLEFRFNRA